MLQHRQHRQQRQGQQRKHGQGQGQGGQKREQELTTVKATRKKEMRKEDTSVLSSRRRLLMVPAPPTTAPVLAPIRLFLWACPPSCPEGWPPINKSKVAAQLMKGDRYANMGGILYAEGCVGEGGASAFNASSAFASAPAAPAAPVAPAPTTAAPPPSSSSSSSLSPCMRAEIGAVAWVRDPKKCLDPTQGEIRVPHYFEQYSCRRFFSLAKTLHLTFTLEILPFLALSLQSSH